MPNINIVRASMDVLAAREKLSSACGLLARTEQSPPAATSALQSLLADLDDVLRVLGEHEPEGGPNGDQSH
jgi:hypothetical protein